MNLVDEQQRAAAHQATLLGGVEDLAQVGDAGKDRRQHLEMQVDLLRDQARERGLAAARRAPQDHRGDLPRRQHAPDRRIRADQVILADDLLQALRAQAVGQRPRRLCFEQA
jgi:hypothetical protein